jgi:nucleoside-diphosphate-sugar epimerase
MPVLLTGATGLVGPYTLQGLLARREAIRVLALPETVDEVRYRDRVEVVMGSLADEIALTEALDGVETVYHLAAVPLGSPATLLRAVNVEGTKNLLRACERAGSVRRFVLNSSVMVYQPAPWPVMWPITEHWPRRAHGNDAIRAYGQSKIDAEDAVLRAHHEMGIDYVILRPTVTYGPGASTAEQIVRQVLNRPRRALDRGRQLGVMQWVHASDLAETTVLAGTLPRAANEIFNVAGSEDTSIPAVAVTLWQILGLAAPRPARHFGLSSRSGDGLKFDTGKAQSMLGYAPRVSLEDGLKEVLMTMDLREYARANNNGSDVMRQTSRQVLPGMSWRDGIAG